jgi:hypothetical protein
MTLLVFSDSHKEVSVMVGAAERESPDMLLHLGDHADDGLALGARFPDIPLRIVRGNCDYNREVGELETLELCGKKIILTHGHLFGVKNGLDRIASLGENANADLVLFGHTHRAYISKSGGMTLFNPGAVCGRGWDKGKTYGIVHVDEKGIKCVIK